MRWYASAPSNIALIKYMGKISSNGNLPTNASLSFTLKHLNSHVEIEPKAATEAAVDTWEPLILKTLKGVATEISPKGQERYLKHLQTIKKHFSYQGSFTVRSVNDFPSDCGLASSASSFAALTLCAYNAMKELSAVSPEDYDESQLMRESDQMSDLSRQGSGSSCRSFFAPWAVWDEQGARSLDLPYGDMVHLAVIADADIKKVSSSEAHQRVTSSALFAGRTERAERRLRELIESLRAGDWRQSYELCWAEFWDMHALFETSQPSFGYMNEKSFRVLESVRKLWSSGDGPLCTMDAGPNVHLLFRSDQKKMANEYSQQLSEGRFGEGLSFYSSI